MDSTLSTKNIPSVADVERIAALNDPVIRNLLITQCYHELSSILTGRTRLNANWCTFATWASKQAGQSIRKEDLARTLERMFTTAPSTVQAAEEVAASAPRIGASRNPQETQALVWKLLNPIDAIGRSSEAVSRGNKKVFEEIGREFARFYATCLNDAAYDAEKITRFCDELRPGDPPEGQSYLRQAFTRYYQALFESDAKRCAELLLLANIEIGFHEQTRLQPEIAEALEVSLVDPAQLTRLLVGASLPFLGWPFSLGLFALRLLRGPSRLELAIGKLVAETQQQIRLLITEHMMTIGLPGGEALHLGQDLRAEYPPPLQQITHPDLRSLLDQVDPTPDSLHESGAMDWSNLPERLHFIVDMFRGYQQTQDLFRSPFTPKQTESLKAGQLPGGSF
ncbi:MAG: hypothetical protein A2Z16_02845 [Chloroflexi bacterium RBG_16_54_18]|nr:MAG: hypothetical protein A2Z16_02845 [Chloroflexi bacterium RBG_16_54_18]